MSVQGHQNMSHNQQKSAKYQELNHSLHPHEPPISQAIVPLTVSLEEDCEITGTNPICESHKGFNNPIHKPRPRRKGTTNFHGNKTHI